MSPSYNRTKLWLWCLFLLLTSLPNLSFAQGEANTWYFGNNIGLDFSFGAPVLINGVNTGENGTTLESSTTVSSPNGDYLFSTNGNHVFDGSGASIATNLSTTTNAAQGNLVIPVPGSTNQFYVCTVDAAGLGCPSGLNRGANYRVFTVAGTGAGNVTIGAETNVVPSEVAECQAAVPKTDGSGDYWWIIHMRGSNTFKVYSVTAGGISFDHDENIGWNFATCSYVSTLKANSCYDQLALAFEGSVHLFDFDGTTGAITNHQNIALAGAYGLEFSPNGDYLYVSTNEVATESVYQFDISTGTFGAFATLGNLTGQLRGGHLQLGPDGNIYSTSINSWNAIGAGDAGPLYIGQISNINANPATFTPQFIEIAGNGQYLSMGLPTFLKSFVSSILSVTINNASASVAQVCVGDVVDLSSEIDGEQATSTTWSIEGNNLSGNGVSYTFNNSGNIPIEVSTTDICDRPVTDTLSVEVLEPQIPTVTPPTCENSTATGTGANATNYLWYDAPSGGNIVHVGSDYTAPSIPHTVWVEDGSPLAGPFTVGATNTQGWGNDGNNAVFEFDALTEITITGFTVFGALHVPGTVDVDVEVRDNSNNLITSASDVTISDMGETTISDLLLIIPPGTGYTMTLTGGQFQPSVGGPVLEAGVIDVTGSTDFYNVIVEKNALCKGRVQVEFEDCCSAPDISIQEGNATTCVDSALILNATPDAGMLTPITYQWYNDVDGAISGATSSSYTVPTNTAVSALDYWVIINSSPSCTGQSGPSDTIAVTINNNPSPPGVTSPIEYCQNEVPSELTATGSNLLWFTSATGGTGNTSAHTPITSAPGNTSYWVNQTENGCSSLRSEIEVQVHGLPSVTANASATGNQICAGQNVTLTGAGATSYTWSHGVTDGQPFSPNTSETYTVTGTDANLCSNTASITVNVNPTPIAALTIDRNTICLGENATLTISVTAGSSPFDISYAGSGTTGTVSLTDQTSPLDIQVNTEETFSLVEISDDNNCTTSAPSSDLNGSETVAYLPDVSANVRLRCDSTTASPDDYIIFVDLTSGDFDSDVVTGSGGVFFTDLGNGSWIATGINENITSDITATDDNNCNGGFAQLNNNLVCSCPEVASISGSASICELGIPEETELTVSFSGGSPGQTYSFDIIEVNSSNIAHTELSHNGDTPFSFSVNTQGTYQLTNVVGSCIGSGLGNVDISYFPSPTGIISGGDTICDDGSSSTPIVLSFTGTPPFDFSFNGTTSGLISENNYSTTTYIHNTLVNESFDWSGGTVIDANGCQAQVADLTGTASVVYFSDPIVDLNSIQYECPNGQFAPHVFNVTMSVSGGQGSGNYLLEDFLANTSSEANLNLSETGGIISILGVDENTIFDLQVSDGNQCNPQLIEDLNHVCSCPTRASLVALTPTTICSEGQVTLELNTTGGIGNYDFTISGDGGSSFTESGYSDFPHTLQVNSNETFTISNFQDNGLNCQAGKQGSILVDFFTAPMAEFSSIGDDTLCSAILNESATLGLNITSGTPDYMYFISTLGSILQGSSNGQTQISVDAAGVYTLDSLQDGNGCHYSFNDQVEIFSQDPIQVTIAASETEICETSFITLSAVPNDSRIRWYNTAAPLTALGTGSNMTLSFAEESGSYFATIDNGQCPESTTASNNIELTIWEDIEVLELPDLFEVLVDETVELTSTTLSGTSYILEWSADDNAIQNILTETESSVAFASPDDPILEGDHSIYFTVQNGECLRTDSTTLRIKVPITIPNLFTPSGDGINETWNIRGITTSPQSVVKVFNRWGSLVWTSSPGYTEQWQGTTNDGKELPVGTYYYVINLNSSVAGMSDNSDTYAGDVTIMK